MILKPENLGTIILISAAQRKKTLREEKDKEDAKTVTLLHNQVFLAPQRNRTKSQLHTGGQAAKERSGESTPSPFSGAQGLKAQSPGCSQGVLRSESLRRRHTSRLRAVCLQQPPKVPLPASTASLRVPPATRVALLH